MGKVTDAHSDIGQQIRQIVAKEMESQDLTRADLVDRLEIEPNTVRRLLNGDLAGSLFMWQRVAQVLGFRWAVVPVDIEVDLPDSIRLELAGSWYLPAHTLRGGS